LHCPLVLRFNEGDGRPSFSGSASSSDPVHICLGSVRQIVVENVRQTDDIETARGNVGGDEHLKLA
jgi:hypothetical protein